LGDVDRDVFLLLGDVDRDVFLLFCELERDLRFFFSGDLDDFRFRFGESRRGELRLLLLGDVRFDPDLRLGERECLDLRGVGECDRDFRREDCECFSSDRLRSSSCCASTKTAWGVGGGVTGGKMDSIA
jgi:hypothetical protein